MHTLFILISEICGMWVVAEFPTHAPSVDTRKGPGPWKRIRKRVEEQDALELLFSEGHAVSVLRARQKRLALSYKQPLAHPGKDILYLPFPLPPADRFALTINLPLHPHKAFVSISLPLSRREEKAKTSRSLVPKWISSCSAAHSWMTWVDMLLPRHPHTSHLDCSVLSNLSMTSLNWAEHHNMQKKIFWHFSWS